MRSIRKAIGWTHEAAEHHKKQVLAGLSLFVLALHFVHPELEAAGFCVSGLICAEFA